MLHSLYITDATPRLVFEYLTHNAPKYATFEASLNNQSSPVHLNNGYYVVFEKVDSLTYYLLCSGQPNPMIPQAFLERFRFIMGEYFGQITANKLKTNTDTVVLVLHEMIHQDMPHITDPNQIKELVPTKSLLSKILNSASTTKPLESEVAWRRSNVKYTKNEIFVDIVETVSVILELVNTNASHSSGFYSASKKTRAVPITGEIQGQVNIKSHLSGVPLLNMTLNRPVDARYHHCVDLNRLSSSRMVEFIPPDGKCVLMDYTVDVTPDTLGLVDVDFQTGMGDAKNEFEVRVFIKEHPYVNKVDKLGIEVVCKDNDALDEDETISTIKAKRVTQGEFRYKGNGRSEWNMVGTKPGSTPVLHGVIHTEKNGPAKPIYLKIKFTYKGDVPSGLRVDSLNIVSAKGMGTTVKPYKGVKYITKGGDYIVRS